MTTTRRQFVGAAAGAALSAGPLAAAARRIVGANDDLRVAVVGVRSRGQDHIQGFERLDGVRVVALCDVDREILAKRREEFAAKAGRDVEMVSDHRRLLDRNDIDVISIATPNHWHSLMAIEACRAGKDVYVEKPVSHNVWEGRQLVRAMQRHRRIVQCGTQSRSNPGLHEAIAFARGGEIGALKLARGLCYKPRGSIGKVGAPTPIPEHIDYDLWCGPAPRTPLQRTQLHYDWHWVWATGNGDLGNQGIHQMDMCRLALGEPQLARRVVSFGGRLGYDDDGETPNTMVTLFEYPIPLVFEVRGLPERSGAKAMDRYLGANIGVVLHCEGGHVAITSYAGGAAFDRDGRQIAKFQGGGDHYANFVAAVRARDAGRLAGPIEDGHVSSALCHVGNASLRVGTALSGRLSDALTNRIELAEAFGRMREHLGANGVDLGATPLTAGAVLDIDRDAERFVGEGEAVAAANALARGSYRAPFAVPEEV